MVDQQNTFFNISYDNNYMKIMKYVISKCSNLSDVQDIVQDIFIEFYALLDKKGIDYIENVEAILIKIAKSKIYRFYTLSERVKKMISLSNRKDDEDENDNDDLIIDDKDIEDTLFNRYTMEEIWKVINGKSEDVKKLFYLYYYCDMTLKEISMMMKLSESNVKHKIYRTLEDIRNIYKGW